jgi:3-deoxy-D-manno-octulosonic-acid transferase
MSAALKLVLLLRADGMRFTAGLTAANRAGVELAARAESAERVSALVPWDAPGWVSRAFDRWRPSALILVETEIWPRLIFEADRRQVPVFCVSGRIYRRDLLRYRAIRPFLAPTLRRLTAVLAQDDVERGRFISLGVPAARCFTSGNLKYASIAPEAESGQRFGHELGIGDGERVLVFGSVHADEVALVCMALASLDGPNWRAIVAPRHASAANALLRETAARGWAAERRSEGLLDRRWRVLVLDAVGDLADAYRLADVAVIGGGFGRHGGHNPFEAVSAGAPVLFGAHFAHFAAEAAALTAATSEARVASAGELAERIASWLGSDDLRQGALERQRRCLPDGRMIARSYVDRLRPWLEPRLGLFSEGGVVPYSGAPAGSTADAQPQPASRTSGPRGGS